MHWKDFLYYQRGQQRAIVILIASLSILLFLNVVLAGRSSSQLQVLQNEELVASFDSFYNGLGTDSKAFEYKEIKGDVENSGSFKSLDRKVDQSPEADTRHVRNSYNRTEKLKSGETILLNNSDTTDWKKIPGIGSAYASRIVKYRSILGGYVSIAQLKEVYGISEELYESIVQYIKHDEGVARINVNKLEFKELLRHPYLDLEQVKVIVNLRDQKGRISSLSELLMFKEFSDEDAANLEPYLEF